MALIDGHDKLAELEAQYESALADVEAEAGEEAVDGGAWFDMAVSIALLYPQEVAEEFLRGKCGYVPQTYKNLLIHRSTS